MRQCTFHDLLEFHLESVHLTLSGDSFVAPLDMVDGKNWSDEVGEREKKRNPERIKGASRYTLYKICTR